MRDPVGLRSGIATASPELQALRRAAVAHTLFGPVDLRTALDRLGFVQADPIRAPARAQDLILWQRVAGYRAGDLERAYPRLPLVEDMVHVYGFLDRRHRRLLHPRRVTRRHVEIEHPRLAKAILTHLRAGGGGHPRVIEDALSARHPRTSIRNAWGGQSTATTRMLEAMHYHGVLHVVRRERGIRVYGLAPGASDAVVPPAADASTLDRPRGADGRLTPVQRAEGLIALLVRLYAPVPAASLGQLTHMLGERAIARDALRARIPSMTRRGLLRITVVDGVRYYWPGEPSPPAPVAPLPAVRFVAPFDPLVWDRRRFALFWGWSYRFEAYVPVAKRQLGYYALPMLWQTDADAVVVGWVNASRRRDGRVDVDPGFAGRRPAGAAFRSAFDAEVARLEAFLANDATDGGGVASAE